MANNGSVQATGVRSAPRVPVALDIGTYGCGFATFAHGRVVQPVVWPDAPADAYCKTRSALLYKGRSPVAWGWSACKQHAQLTAEQLSEGSYWYIEDFKLALQDDTHAAALRAKGLTPEQVMADFLRPFISYVKQQLPASVKNQELQWCLTVPAMWSEASKQLMRKAAVRAGLIRTQDSDALMIILEPEAAAVHAMENRAPPLVKGMTVCILDVGGGTADITVHDVKEVAGRSVLAEAVAAHGELCGSVYVDKAFREYYRTAVGATAFDTWSEQHPAELQQVMNKWIACKHAFTSTDSCSHNPYRVFIPPSLSALMQGGASGSAASRDVLLDAACMTSLFRKPVDQILQAATASLKQLNRHCSMVILVGGFAASPYLQSRVKQALVTDSHLASQLVVPPMPYAAVMCGAVQYGRCPDVIHARMSRMCYGISACRPYISGDPVDNRFMVPEEGVYYVDNHFCKFVSRGELVQQEQEVLHYFAPLSASQTNSFINVYATDNNNLRYATTSSTDARQLGRLTLNHPAGAQRVICVSFKFGNTEFVPTAWDAESNEKVHSEFKFAHA